MKIITLADDQMAGPRPPIEPVSGSWIAGGAVRRWFNGGEELQDVDVFSPSAEGLEMFKKARLSAFDESHKTANATSYWNGKVKAQLITGKFFLTPETCLDAFDFTLRQFAWTSEGIFATDKAIISTLRKQLSVHRITREFALDSMRRAFKYQRKGFEPCLGTIRDIAAVIRSLSEEELKAQVELSPAGGKRFVRFD